VLSRLVIGGKTGSINNRQHTRRMDWFVGFAREKNGTEQLVVAVVVGHGEYIRTKASEFAKFTIMNYFKEYFASTDNEKSQAG
jgi:cell division protein FtsI/penicillin-binding protein 2